MVSALLFAKREEQTLQRVLNGTAPFCSSRIFPVLPFPPGWGLQVHSRTRPCEAVPAAICLCGARTQRGTNPPQKTPDISHLGPDLLPSGLADVCALPQKANPGEKGRGGKPHIPGSFFPCKAQRAGAKPGPTLRMTKKGPKVLQRKRRDY